MEIQLGWLIQLVDILSSAVNSASTLTRRNIVVVVVVVAVAVVVAVVAVVVAVVVNVAVQVDVGGFSTKSKFAEKHGMRWGDYEPVRLQTLCLIENLKFFYFVCFVAFRVAPVKARTQFLPGLKIEH